MQSPGQSRKAGKQTSWGGVADWYAEHLENADTYHAKVVTPNLVRVLKPGRGMRVLDLACGEGYIARKIEEHEATVVGADISDELITKAKGQGGAITYHTAPADNLSFAKDHSFDAVTCVLALQNMEKLEPVFREVARVLVPGGRFIFVLNHPVLRVPKRSSWIFDDKKGVQARRLDGYYIPSREKMYMHPGKTKEFTWSFHRSLEEYAKTLARCGFVIAGLEEWISHKTSEAGPRQAAEDLSRKEFPLFMMLETRTSV